METSQQLTVIVDKLARIHEAVKYLSVQLTLLQLSTKEEGRPLCCLVKQRHIALVCPSFICNDFLRCGVG